MIGRRPVAFSSTGPGKRKRDWRQDGAADDNAGSNDEADQSRRRASGQDLSERSTGKDVEGDEPNSPESDGPGQRRKAFAWMDSDDEAGDSEEAKSPADAIASSAPAHRGPEEDTEKHVSAASSSGTSIQAAQAQDPSAVLRGVETFGEFMRICESIRQAIGSMSAENLVELCKTAARVKFYDGDLFDEVFTHLIPKTKSQELSPSQLADILQCLIDLNACDPGFVAAAVASLTPKMGELDKAMRLRWMSLLGDLKSPSCEAFLVALRTAPVLEESNAAQSSTSGRIACRHFARGFCATGKNCVFSHEAGLLPPPTSNPVVMTQMQLIERTQSNLRSAGISTKPPCRHFLRGFCANGTACIFRHDMASPVALQATAARIPVRATTKLCIHFASGACSWGAKCHFLHTVNGQV